MIRVSTPRRNPLQTLQILSWASQALGVNALAYGSSMEEILDLLNKTGQSGIKLQLINILGVLDRQKMREVNEVCEVFLDFSSWQAFGRSGIEAMASGVIPILPQEGGASCYAKTGENSFLIDTSDMAQVKQVLKEITQGKYNLRNMRDAALATAAGYSLENSSRKTYRIFRGFYERWRGIRITGGPTRLELQE
jgi:glycosyltransferase involved in cell wall biosynthesis